jgi:hypothetical protein
VVECDGVKAIHDECAEIVVLSTYPLSSYGVEGNSNNGAMRGSCGTHVEKRSKDFSEDLKVNSACAYLTISVSGFACAGKQKDGARRFHKNNICRTCVE